jgi:hypothetical protein
MLNFTFDVPLTPPPAEGLEGEPGRVQEEGPALRASQSRVCLIVHTRAPRVLLSEFEGKGNRASFLERSCHSPSSVPVLCLLDSKALAICSLLVARACVCACVRACVRVVCLYVCMYVCLQLGWLCTLLVAV